MKNNRLLKIFLLFLLTSFLVLLSFLAAPALSKPEAALRVTVAVITEPDTLDLTATRLAPISNPIGNNIYERLIDIKPSGELTSGIASWEILEDGKVFKFTLRRGIKFHSGDPVTTKDVRFSHERMLKFNDSYKRAMRKFYDFLYFEEKIKMLDPVKREYRQREPKPIPRFLRDKEIDLVNSHYFLDNFSTYKMSPPRFCGNRKDENRSSKTAV